MHVHVRIRKKTGWALAFQEKAEGFCENILFQNKDFSFFAYVRGKCTTGFFFFLNICIDFLHMA